MSFIQSITIIVHDYDEAIAFFVDKLGFDLIEDSPSVTSQGGHPKRWVVVRPPGAQTGILLARADGERQAAAVGNQVAGRVGFFLRVVENDSGGDTNKQGLDAFEAKYNHMRAAGVRFVSEPRTEAYGRLAVFLDVAGNRWDLLGPPPPPPLHPQSPPSPFHPAAATSNIRVDPLSQNSGRS